MRKLGPFRFQSAALFLPLLVVSVQPVGPVDARPSASQDIPRTISIAAHVTEASQRFGISERWIYAVMRAESAGRVSATSHAGAMGLMQIMPATWAMLRARYRLGFDPYDPRDNIHAGTAYMREMYNQFGVSGFLAAYNAGPGRYGEYVRKDRRLPRETRIYVAKIMPEIVGGSSYFPASKAHLTAPESAPPVRVHWTQSDLFVAREAPDSRDKDSTDQRADLIASAPNPVSQNAPSEGLFAPISGQASE